MATAVKTVQKYTFRVVGGMRGYADVRVRFVPAYRDESVRAERDSLARFVRSLRNQGINRNDVRAWSQATTRCAGLAIRGYNGKLTRVRLAPVSS